MENGVLLSDAINDSVNQVQTDSLKLTLHGNESYHIHI